MTWDEFTKKQPERITVYGDFAKTNITCPDCGELIYRDMSVVMPTNPPRFQYFCSKCGWEGWS